MGNGAIFEKAIKAAKGIYETEFAVSEIYDIGEGSGVDFAAMTDDTCFFVSVSACDGEFEDSSTTRQEFEKAAIDFATSHLDECHGLKAFEFDKAAVNFVSDSHGIVRLHRNCVGVG